MTQKIFSPPLDNCWNNLFFLLLTGTSVLISFSERPFPWKRDLSAFFILPNFTKGNKEKPDSIIPIAIVEIDLKHFFIVHLFGSIIYYFRIHTCSSFSFSLRPYIRLDQITQTIFSRVRSSETIFFLFHPSGIFFVLLAATSVLDPMEKNGRIYGRPRCAFKCVLFSMDVWSESSRNLAVNMHGTTCQTSFCINKTSPTLMCGRAQTGNKKDSEHMQHLKVTFQQKLSIC